LTTEISFAEHAYAKVKEAILRCASPVASDVYAISFFIENLDDDPRKPTLILGYNTHTYWRKSIAHASSADEAKWNFAFWPQTCEAFVGNTDDAQCREMWIKRLGSWCADQDDDGGEITRQFMELAVEIAKRLHDEGIILQKFTRVVPILIHEQEYYLDIARLTERANPPDSSREFSNWIESLYT